MRKDSDLLGELLLADDVYYGAQTLRALQMYTPSEERINRFPSYVFAMAAIKKALRHCQRKDRRAGLGQMPCHRPGLR